MFPLILKSQEGKKIKCSVCVSVCLCVCVNETPTLIFYVRMLSDVSSLIWMPLMDGHHQWMALTWRNHRLPGPTRINLSLYPSFHLSVRAKRGIWSKRVLIRKIGNFCFSVHWRNTTIIHFFLLGQKVLNIFWEMIMTVRP
jgi:hypothetical protein